MLWLAVLAKGAEEYRVIDLGPNAYISPAFGAGMGINNLGEVTGNWAPGVPDDFTPQAFHFSPEANPNTVSVQSLSNNGAYGGSINSLGQIVGESWNSSVTDNVISGFLYSPAPPPPSTILLPTLHGTDGNAWDINDSGQITGFARTAGDVASHAYIYTPGIIPFMEDLGTLSGASGESTGLSINGRGEVAGYSNVGGLGSAEHAFVFSPRTVPNLKDIHPKDLQVDSDYSYALGLNTYGEAVGFYLTDVGNRGFISRFYPDLDPERESISLRPLDNSESSIARAINESGIAVGESTYMPNGSNDDTHAVIWTTDGKPSDLNELILTGPKPSEIPPKPGWTLQKACAINELGQIAAYGTFGYGTFDDVPHAFLLQPLKFYHQGDNNADVPLKFGRDDAPQTKKEINGTITHYFDKDITQNTGCVLTSVTNMLRTVKGFDKKTVVQIDAMLLKNGVYNDTNGIILPKVASAVGLGGSLEYKVVPLPSNASITDCDIAIKKYLREGYRILLRFEEKLGSGTFEKGHTVMVAGRTVVDGTPQWWIYDPGWKSATESGRLDTLSGHMTGFTTGSTLKTLRTFRIQYLQMFRDRRERVTSDDLMATVFLATAQCPVELLVTDPQGRRIGVDPIKGTSFGEVPDGTYSNDGPNISATDDSIHGDPYGNPTAMIHSPASGSYQVLVTGIGSGPYTLDLVSVGPGGGSRTKTVAGTASVGSKNIHSATVPVAGNSDLDLAQTASLVLAHIGDTVVYQIKVDNKGPDTATGVSVSSFLPALTTFESVAASMGVATQGGGVVKIDIDSLPVGSSATAEIRVRTTSQGPLDASGSVVAYEIDPVRANNTSMCLTSVDDQSFATAPGADSPANNAFPKAGGNGQIDVTATTGCAWTAQTTDSWITITSGSLGNGNGTINYSVETNAGTNPRSGTIQVGNQTVTVSQLEPSVIPSVTTHPGDAVSYVGGKASFSVTASGSPPLNYEWRFNGEPISGATGSTFQINNLSSSQDGAYTVQVSNGTGSVVSRAAYLCVTPDKDWPVEYEFCPRGPIPNGMFLNGICYNGTGFVAAGNKGVIVKSIDGISWEYGESTVTCDLSSLAAGNGETIAVGENGTILRSFDAGNWHRCASPTTKFLRTIAFGNKRFVVAGDGVIITSSDGITWKTRLNNSYMEFKGIAFGGGQFLAVGLDRRTNNALMMSSPDGTTWKQIASGIGSRLNGIFHTGIGFVAVGNAGTVAVSTDGATWSIRSKKQDIEIDFLGICGGDGLTIIAGRYGEVRASTDNGWNWSPVDAKAYYDMRGAAFANGTFALCGRSSIRTSNDGIDWVPRGDGPDPEYLAENDGVIYGTTTGKVAVPLTCADGRKWTSYIPREWDGEYAVSGNGRLVSQVRDLPLQGGLYASVDGVSWELSRPAEILGYSYGPIYESFVGRFVNDKFMFVGDYVTTSVDGLNWSDGPKLGFSGNDIAFGNGVYVVVGNSGRIGSSSDGVVWKNRLSGTSDSIFGVCFFNSRFIAFTDTNILSSADGYIWSIQKVPDGWSTDNNLTIGKMKNRIFVSGKKSYMESADGRNWVTKGRVSGGYFVNCANRVYTQGGYVPGGAVLLGIAKPKPKPSPAEILVKAAYPTDDSSLNLVDGGAELDFGDGLVGSPGRTISCVISNIGDMPLSGVKLLKAGANSGDFEISDLKGETIKSGSNLKFKITFKPSAKGGKNAIIKILSSDDDEREFTISVKGTARSTLPIPSIEVKQSDGRLLAMNSTLDCGVVKVGQKSSVKKISIRNVGKETLNGFALSFVEGGASSHYLRVSWPPDKANLRPGESYVFSVWFEPREEGVWRGTAKIRRNYTDLNPFRINFKCEAR